MSQSPVPELPSEIWATVPSYLDSTNIKNARLVSQMVCIRATQSLFRSITVSPTIRSLRKLQQITSQRSGYKLPCDCVKEVVFDLSPLWDNPYRSGRRWGEETVGDSSDYTARAEWDTCHFAVRGFADALRRLSIADTIKVTTKAPGWTAWAPFALGQYDVPQIFFQLLSLCDVLPRRIKNFQVGTGQWNQLALDIFDGELLWHRTFRPTLPSATPPLSLQQVSFMERNRGLALFAELQRFDIHLYDRRYLSKTQSTNRMQAYCLRDALAIMSTGLRHLRIVISTPGELPQEFSRCRCTFGRKTDLITFTEVFGDTQFERLTDVDLQHLSCSPTVVGKFLSVHEGILEHLNIASWSCGVPSPEANTMQELREAAGPALRLLTLEACESEFHDLCLDHDFLVPPRTDMELRRYSYMSTEKLVALILDHGLMRHQLPFAMCHEVYLDTPLGQRSFRDRPGGVSEQHHHQKLREQSAYREAMMSLTAEELARIAVTEEQLLMQFFAIDEYLPNDHIPNQQERHRDMLKNDLSKFFTFTINGVAGLYRWFCGAFEHFNFDRWTATCEVESLKYRGKRTSRRSWRNPALFAYSYWEKDVESRLLTVIAHLTEPECRGRGHFSCTCADVLQLLAEVESYNYKGNGNFDARPSKWDMPSKLTVADLGEAREVIPDIYDTLEVVEAMQTLAKKSEKHKKWVVSDRLGESDY